MSVHQVAGMITVGHGLMTAARAVNMILFVTAAIVASRALVGILGGNLDGVMLYVTAVFLMMQMPVVQIVDMVAVFDGGVAAVLSVVVIVMITVVVMTHDNPPFLSQSFVMPERCSSPAAERDTPMQTIQYSCDERGVATVLINRPEVHNAFNLQVVEELHQTFRDLPESVRVVVLRGQGKSFSAGADVEWMRGQAVAGQEENRKGARQMAEMFQAIDNCRCPVVAVIQGAALGGGTGLTCAVDIAIAGPKALFGFTEVRLGIVPAVISPYAIRRLGYSKAKLHFLLGDRINAENAYRLGLVHYLSEDPETQLAEVLEHLLAGSPAAQARTKRLARTSYELEDPTDFTIDQITAARAHPDGREGLSAFLEKRAPKWS